MTECNQDCFQFAGHFSRQVVAQFDGARMTTNGGSLLLRQVDRKIQLLKRVARCFRDGRDPRRVEHALEEMLAQRIYGLALGYEDLNDHEELRHDPLLAVLADVSTPIRTLWYSRDAGRDNDEEANPQRKDCEKRYCSFVDCLLHRG
jgi:hypothetical protein